MFCRILNPGRVSMVVASLRRTIHYENNSICRNTYPQKRKLKPSPQVLPRAFFSEIAEAKVEETNHLSRILQGKDWCLETAEKLNGLAHISEDDVLSALRTLNPDKALCFFDWYKKHNSYKPSSSVYNELLRVVGKKSHIYHFWELTEQMKGEGFCIEQHTFSLFSARCRGDEMTKHLANLFIWMIENENAEAHPSASNCSRVLHCLSRERVPDLKIAYIVIEAFKNCGGSMDKMLYEGLHRCLTKAGRFGEAGEVMQSMANEGFIPDKVTYGQLIYGLCTANRPGEALQSMREMREKGWNPDWKTWKIIIQCHCNANETDKALELFLEMVESGWDTDNIIEGLVIHLCNNKRIVEAYNLMCKTIEDQNTKPSLATYVEVIDKLTQSEMLKEACNMFDVMQGQGYDPYAKPVFELLGKLGTVDEAYGFLVKTGLTAKRCATMFSAFCNAGRQSDADDLLSRCPPQVSKSTERFKIPKVVSTNTENKSERKWIEAMISREKSPK